MSFERIDIGKMKETAVPEKIVTAAVEYNGEIFKAPIHAMALEELQMVHPEVQHDSQYKNGFLTSAGRFVGRDEAAQIADLNDQIKAEVRDAAVEGKGLYSEDLKREMLN